MQIQIYIQSHIIAPWAWGQQIITTNNIVESTQHYANGTSSRKVKL